MSPKTKKVCFIGIFIALGVAVGYIFLFIPNIELVTATIFISGYVLGVRNGIFIGIAAETIFSLTNPYGIPSPPLLIAQIVSMGFAGLLGGVFSTMSFNPNIITFIKFSLAGLISTLFFALSTNLSFVISMGFQLNKFFATMLTGLHFYIIHIISNMIIFATLVPLLIHKFQNNKAINQIKS